MPPPDSKEVFHCLAKNTLLQELKVVLLTILLKVQVGFVDVL
jgi:hypothetical protein